MLKFDEPFRNYEILVIFLFPIVQIWVLRVTFFVLQFLVDILPLGPGSGDPHIFADPDPGSQNLADPTDPDPKHWLIGLNVILKSQQIVKTLIIHNS